jgi:ComF family protein
MIYDFLNLFIPLQCSICNTKLVQKETIICHLCEYRINRAQCLEEEKKAEAIINQRIPYQSLFILLELDDKGRTQNLIHNIKYKGEKKAAYYFGQILAKRYENKLSNIDYISYVPLHHKKEKIRGYNQSQMIASGIANYLKIPILESLNRLQNAETQTKMNKQKRWENAQDSFYAKENLDINEKHILLVDDVITTGATSEACYKALKSKYSFQLSLAYLAIAL